MERGERRGVGSAGGAGVNVCGWGTPARVPRAYVSAVNRGVLGCWVLVLCAGTRVFVYLIQLPVAHDHDPIRRLRQTEADGALLLHTDHERGRTWWLVHACTPRTPHVYPGVCVAAGPCASHRTTPNGTHATSLVVVLRRSCAWRAIPAASPLLQRWRCRCYCQSLLLVVCCKAKQGKGPPGLMPRTTNKCIASRWPLSAE